MHHTYVRMVTGVATVAVAALAGASPALAAHRHAHTHIRHARHHAVNTTSSSSSTAQGNGETALTGSTLTSAEDAAVAANPGQRPTARRRRPTAH